MSKLLAVLDKLPVVAFTLFVPTMFFWTFPDMGFVVSLAISVFWWVLVFRAGWIKLADISNGGGYIRNGGG